MSATVNGVGSDALEQWLAQMKEMQDALANLKTSDTGPSLPYGHDLDAGESVSPGTSSEEDIWDLISDDEADEDSSSNDELHSQAPYVDGNQTETYYNRDWLEQVCAQIAAGTTGLAAADLEELVSTLLVSDISDEDTQLTLADTLGYDELDLVAELLSHRTELVKSLSSHPTPGEANDLGQLQTGSQREEALRRQDYEHKYRALAPRVKREAGQYPHVYKSHAAGNTLSASGHRYALPEGSKRDEHKDYEEYSIPAIPVGALGQGQQLVTISSLDGLCKRTFKGYTTLNRMQSLLYPSAYETNENMLISAPTGAGKTDAAMLTILNTVAKNTTPDPSDDKDATDFVVHTDAFKIVYVAPMKALAAEITEKFSKRLAWLGVQVRELTGDMHLTKSEIVQTQILVTTPEKWDVVTRKSTGDTELVQKVRLLIIDEVRSLTSSRVLWA